MPNLLPIILTLALIILTYIWSQKLLGKWWAILSPSLLTFSLILLYYDLNLRTSLIITAAFFYTLTIYALIEFFLKPSRLNLILTSINLGIAYFIGFYDVNFLLLIYFLILVLIFYIASIKRDWLTTELSARFKRFGIRALRYFRSIIVIFILGLIIELLLAFIWFEYFGSSYDEFGMPVRTILKPYFIDVSNSYNNLIFLISIYWPFIILTTSALIYSLIGIIKSFRISGFKGFWDYLVTSFPEFSMIVFIIMYGVFVIFMSGLSKEKLIPILPMVYILTTSGLKRFFNAYL